MRHAHLATPKRTKMNVTRKVAPAKEQHKRVVASPTRRDDAVTLQMRHAHLAREEEGGGGDDQSVHAPQRHTLGVAVEVVTSL
jgi:hypothetical protein